MPHSSNDIAIGVFLYSNDDHTQLFTTPQIAIYVYDSCCWCYIVLSSPKKHKDSWISIYQELWSTIVNPIFLYNASSYEKEYALAAQPAEESWTDTQFTSRPTCYSSKWFAYLLL
jgi:hypothetical protein